MIYALENIYGNEYSKLTDRFGADSFDDAAIGESPDVISDQE